MKSAALAALAAAIVGTATMAAGCFPAPEACKGCQAAGAGGGTTIGGAGMPDGTGGGVVASGGTLGAGGGPVIGTGGTSAAANGGGAGGTGGAAAAGSGGLPVASGGASVPGTGGRGGAGGGVGASGGSDVGAAPGTGGMIAAAGGMIAAPGGMVASNGGMVATGGRGGAGGAAASTGGMIGSGGSAGVGGSGTAGAAGGGDLDLVLLYKFDESSGTTAADSSGFAGGPRNGTLTVAGAGTATFSTTKMVGTHSVAFGGTTSSTVGGYVTTPSLQTLAPTAVTIAAWVFINAEQNWQRVFDFGTSTSSYMFLTTHSNDGGLADTVRFAITTTGMGAAAEQRINNAALLSLNAWHHIAVVLPAGTTYRGTLYIDGVAAGTNAAMTLHPTDLGATTGNYIGKSQFPSDAYFSGQIDDFRVYKRALTAAEITTVFGLR